MTVVFWIVEYCSSFIEAFLCTTFCGTFLDVAKCGKLLKRKALTSATFSFIMLLLNHINLFSILTTFIALSLGILLNIVVFRKKLIKLLVLSITALLIIVIIDSIVVSIVSFSLKIPTSEIYQEFSLYRLLAIISSKTILVLTIIIINKLLVKKRPLQRKYLFILFGVTTIMFLITVLITFMEIKHKTANSAISILFFAVMLILLMVIFFGTFKLTEYYENQEKLKLITLKNHVLEQSMNETEQTFMLWKKSMHDYKHNIANLMSLANDNDINGIKKHLQNENELLNKKLFYYKTGNDTVDTILNIKQRTAENQGIVFIINAEIPDNSNIENAHFASILGNLLDNAIEASAKEETPFIEVKIKQVKSYLMIVISNKCTKVNTELKTTKSDKHLHGIGLSSVKQTVKGYKGTFATECKDNVFNAEIMIPI